VIVLLLCPLNSFAAIHNTTNIPGKNVGSKLNISEFNTIIEAVKSFFRDDSNGNVGIGTSSPSTTLDVAGTVTATAFVGDGSGLTGLGAGKFIDGVDTNDAVYETGNVGVGTSTPSTELEVVGTITASSFVGDGTGLTGIDSAAIATNAIQDAEMDYTEVTLIDFTNDAGFINSGSVNDLSTATLACTANQIAKYNGSIWECAADENDAVWYDNAGDISYLAGNVGIGTSTPLTDVHLSGSKEISITGNINEANAAKIGLFEGAYDSRYGLQFNLDGSTNKLYLQAVENANVVSTPVMTFERSGNVGVGTTSPLAKLHIDTGATTEEGLIIKGVASQSANLTEWQDSAGTVVSAVNETGRIIADLGTDSTNFFVGDSAGNTTNSGARNNAIGYLALNSLTSGNDNVTLGVQAGQNITTGVSNTFIGKSSGNKVETGGTNVAIGINAMLNSATGVSQNIAIGSSALSKVGANANIGIGINAGFYLGANSTGNVFIGSAVAQGSSEYTSAYYNTIVGDGAGFNIASNAQRNTTLGYKTARNLTSGTNNLLLGYQAGDNLTTGSSNVLIGYDIDAQSATGSNQLSIGNLIFGTGIDGTGTAISTGNIGIGIATPLAKLHIDTDSTTDIGQIIQGVASQSGDLLQLQDSASANVFKVNYRGDTTTRQIYHNEYLTSTANTQTFLNSIDLTGVGSAHRFIANSESELVDTDGMQNFLSATARINQTGTASYNGLYVDINEISLGDGTSGDGNNIANFAIEGVSKMVVNNLGNVGINETTPLAKLHIDTGATTEEGLIVKGVTSQSANLTEWQDSAGTALSVVDENGNIGIGTSSPTSKVHLYGAGGQNYGTMTEASDGAGVWNLFKNTAKTWKIGMDGTEKFTIYDEDNSRYVITALSDGNVGIGEATPLAKLHIDTGTTTEEGLIVKGVALQTANLSEWQDSAGTAISAIDETGRFIADLGTDVSNLFIGNNAGDLALTGKYNLGVGTDALSSLTDGEYNVALGRIALANLTTGDFNTAIGNGAGNNITTGSSNLAVGASSGNFGTGGTNVAIGQSAMSSSSGASQNVAIGKSALGTMTASQNVAIGLNSGYYNSDGTGNVFIGLSTGAGSGVHTGVNSNVFIGTRAGQITDTGASNNVLIGYQTGDNLTTGNANIVIGNDIDIQNATGSNQLSIGNLIFGTGIDGTGTNISTGNIGIGTTSPLAKLHLETGSTTEEGLIVKGVTSQSANLSEWQDSTGNVDLAVTSNGDLFTDRWLAEDSNTFIGINIAGANNMAGGAIRNTGVGNEALYNTTTGHSNSAFGWRTLRANTTGYGNNAIGRDAMYFNTTGYNNNAVGFNAMYYNTSGVYNNAEGSYALYSNTTGGYNTASGGGALQYNTTGSSNVAVGALAGRYYGLGTDQLQTGYENVFIGRDTRALADGDNNEVVIGYGALGIGSNTVVLGNDSITTTALKGNIGIGTISPQSKLTINGGVSHKITEVDTATYTIAITDYTIATDYTATGAVTLTLPSAATCFIDGTGCEFKIKDSGCNANTNNITINRDGTDTIIDSATGQTSTIMTVSCGALSIQAKDASTWIAY